ncbi:MAG: CPBP family intramembrane glutamic endopeptidase [Gilvibacter sp.]
MISLNQYRGAELFVLFVLMPVSFCFDYSIFIKAGLVLAGLAYIIVLMLRDPNRPFKINPSRPWNKFLKRMFLQFIIIALVTTGYVYWMSPSSLFCVPLNKPLLWGAILGIYTFLSVWPQEIIYRTFFFTRYASLFKSKSLLIFVNAILFSLAHIFFRNTLVMVLTFIGGVLFAITYIKTKSTLMVSIEHALYGNWLFTVGMGEMLAFPGMESC